MRIRFKCRFQKKPIFYLTRAAVNRVAQG